MKTSFPTPRWVRPRGEAPNGYNLDRSSFELGSGEERFQVRFSKNTGIVEYEIRAFSRPRHWLARLAYPITRRLQSRFRRDSGAAMRRAVSCDLHF